VEWGEFLDLLPCMRMYKSRRLYYDHCHLSPDGKIVVAKELKLVLNNIFE